MPSTILRCKTWITYRTYIVIMFILYHSKLKVTIPTPHEWHMVVRDTKVERTDQEMKYEVYLSYFVRLVCFSISTYGILRNRGRIFVWKLHVFRYILNAQGWHKMYKIKKTCLKCMSLCPGRKTFIVFSGRSTVYFWLNLLQTI